MSTSVTTAVVNARPQRVLNEATLMFVRITQVLNKRDDLGDKIKRTSFYNTQEDAKAAAFNLQSENGVGYLWMTKTIDTLKDDGSVDRVNENFMWTKRNQWQRKDTKAYTITAEEVAKATNSQAGNVTPEPEADDSADF